MVNLNLDGIYKANIKQKAVEGFFFLSFRRVILYITAFVSNVILARNLQPSDFGLFAIISFIITIIYNLSDLGLNAAVIQNKEELDRKAKKSVFTIQIIIFSFLTLIFYLSYKFILEKFYHIAINLDLPILIFYLGLFFNVLSSFPDAILERSLEFKKVAFIDILSTVIYQISAVIMSYLHYGIMSLVIAFSLLYLCKLIFTWIYAKFFPEIGFSFIHIKKLLKFGISYQLSTIVNMIKDSITPIFIGSVLGAYTVGLLDWAKKVIIIPSLVTESFGRIAYPSYSRLQNDRQYLGNVIGKSMQLITFITFPISLYLAIFGKDLIHIIYTDKWLPALPVLYLFSLGAFFSGMVTPMYQGILSLGKSRTIFKMSIILLILEWGLGIPAIIRFGYIGIALVSGPISWLFVFIYYFILKRNNVVIKMRKTVFNNMLISILSFLIIYFIKNSYPVNIFWLLITSILVVIIYLLLSLILNKNTIKILVNMIYSKYLKENIND
jgi:teichuronic acid exporter